MIGTISFSTWVLLSGPILSGMGIIAKMIVKRLDSVGDHLKRQDRRSAQTERRLIRLETKAGMNPLPPIGPDEQ